MINFRHFCRPKINDIRGLISYQKISLLEPIDPEQIPEPGRMFWIMSENWTGIINMVIVLVNKIKFKKFALVPSIGICLEFIILFNLKFKTQITWEESQ